MKIQVRLPTFRFDRTFATGIGAVLIVLVSLGGAGRVTANEPIVLPRVNGLPDDAQQLLNEFEKQANGLRAEAERLIAAQRAALKSELQQLQTRYTRAGSLDAAVAVRNLVRSLDAEAAFGGRQPAIFQDPGTMSGFRQWVGQTFYIHTIGATQGSVWGSDVYTDDSLLAAAAVHAGLLPPNQPGIVKVTMLPPSPQYTGSLRNGVQSLDYSNPGEYYRGFKVERAEDEIVALARFTPLVRFRNSLPPAPAGGGIGGDLDQGSVAILDPNANAGIGGGNARPAISPPPAPFRPGREEFVRIHSRFPGEIARLGTTTDESPGPDGKPVQRTLQPGDRVEKGQMLATVLSTEVADKKSDLLDSQTKLLRSQSALEWNQKLQEKRVVGESQVLEAQRGVEAAQIAVDRARRALLIWGIPNQDIEALLDRAKNAPPGKALGEVDTDLSWAEIQIRSPTSGFIQERNCNVGEIIDTQLDLFKILTLAAPPKSN